MRARHARSHAQDHPPQAEKNGGKTGEKKKAFVTHGKIPPKSYIQCKNEVGKLKHIITLHESDHPDFRKVILDIADQINLGKLVASDVRLKDKLPWVKKTYPW